MECSIASSYSSEKPKSAPVTPNGLSAKSDKTPKSGLKVNFTEKGEVKERREKFLTAKYGSHQMNLIRKRLAVEMWLYEDVQKLCTAAIASQMLINA
ncbi:hypothetical protein V9T40_002178 [Parthenolecanium corni]|uniref:Uncharacterized protein n=1 Tax=Parthenolecanium corni TaxID=536013 RepID=A0AAN9Y546_9HEMI